MVSCPILILTPVLSHPPPFGRHQIPTASCNKGMKPAVRMAGWVEERSGSSKSVLNECIFLDVFSHAFFTGHARGSTDFQISLFDLIESLGDLFKKSIFKGSMQSSSWWLNQPIWKICSSIWLHHLPKVRGENSKKSSKSWSRITIRLHCLTPPDG